MSRDITNLSPAMQILHAAFMVECARRGLTDVVTICTDRSNAEQAACFASGASNARPGESAHNALDASGKAPSAEAFDIGIIRDGKYIGDGKDPDYLTAGQAGEAVGLVWAGRWVGKIKESAHFQNPAWKTPRFNK